MNITSYSACNYVGSDRELQQELTAMRKIKEAQDLELEVQKAVLKKAEQDFLTEAAFIREKGKENCLAGRRATLKAKKEQQEEKSQKKQIRDDFPAEEAAKDKLKEELRKVVGLGQTMHQHNKSIILEVKG